MCGISGLVNCGNRNTLERMTAIQSHRGPDDGGTWEKHFPDGSYVGLGSRRLAILDLTTAGHMPMPNEDRNLWITYNGEVYNFRELRAELESKGHRFQSNTDTEVALRLYEQDGPDAVRRLNGMFAFAVCDLRKGAPEIFLARDHFGIKPLYYAQRGCRLAFASEIKALLEVPGIDGELDIEALHQYLTFLWVPDPKTMFRNILKLPAGHYAVWREGELRLTRYWDLEFPAESAKFNKTEDELVYEVRERLQRSVDAQMISDVPVGAFLSAGLDSSSIAALMAKQGDRSFQTYTITFPDEYRLGESTLDDPEVSARTARQLGCLNHTIVVEPDVAGLLPLLTWHMDEPTADPALITAYLVCREAKRHSSVLLSGVGGDELFAGYRKHIAHRWADMYSAVPKVVRAGIGRVIADAPTLRGTAFKGAMRLLKKMGRSASLSPVERFVMNCTYLDGAEKNSLYKPAIQAELGLYDAAQTHRETFERVRHADFLNQMLYMDTKIFMTSLNLTYNDKMSMASSVEVRVPFLDRELAEFVAQEVPPQMKLKGRLRPVTKYILRRAMEGILPDEVLRQPKAGFAAPIDYWLANDLREMVDDLLSETRIHARGLFEPVEIRRMVTQHRQGIRDWSMQIWQFLTLELWMQSFTDRTSSTPNFQPQVAMA